LIVLALLGHGSAIFLAIPLVVFAFWRAMPNRRWIAVAITTALVLYLPWQAYQHWGDPPGDRLVKWQIGGEPEITQRGTLQTIVDDYRVAGVGGTLHNKLSNVEAIVWNATTTGELEEARRFVNEGHFGETLKTVRRIRFYNLLPCLGFLLLGPLAMGLRALRSRGRPRGPEWRFALQGGALTLAACVVWILLLFGNTAAETVIHQGTLAVPLLAIAVCAAAAYASDRRFGIGLVTFNALFVLALYAPEMSPPPESSYSIVAALVAALALGGFCWTVLRSPWTTETAEYTLAP